MVILVQDFTIYSQPKVKKHWRDQAWFYGRQLLRRPLAYIALREASRVVFGSETIRKRVVPMMRIPSKKTRIVYLGVDPSFQGRDHANRPLGNRPYFIVISTVLSYKDLKTAISAFAHASPTMQNGNVDLIIVGEILDRELHQALLQQARELGVMEYVHFLGGIPFSWLPGLYQNAFALLFPSLLESFGLPLVEAMASGTPVIASDIETCMEVCGDAALYFRQSDASDLSQKILSLWNNSTAAQTYREKGMRRSENFSWDRAATHMLQIFQEAVEERKSL